MISSLTKYLPTVSLDESHLGSKRINILYTTIHSTAVYTDILSNNFTATNLFYNMQSL